MNKYKNLIKNVLVMIVTMFVTWISLLLISVFLAGPSKLNSQLKDMYASVRNQIVDARGVSHSKKTETKKNIKGVSTDIFEDDSKQAEKAFKSYLTIDSAKDYADVKKLVTNQFTSESNFVKMFFESDTFTNKMSFKSLDVIMKSWSEDGSVAYNSILSYTVNGKEHRRLVTFTMFYNTDDRTSRDLKDVQVNDAEFM